MPHPFDAMLKDIVAPHPEDFVPVFGLPTIQPASALNVDLSTISAATDVAFGFGDPIQEIVDLNFQSGPDPDVAERCHVYNAVLNLRFKVPVRTLLILLRPKADVSEVQGKLAYSSGQSQVEFTYEVIRMWQQPIEPFLHGGVNVLPLATLCQLPADRPVEESLREVVQEIGRQLAEKCEHAEAARLMKAAFVLTGLRVQREMVRLIYERVRLMHDSSAFEVFEENGAIWEAERILLRQGQKRLGTADEVTVAALKNIRDLDRLDRLLDAVLSAASWRELLDTP